jgi:hypothetical protein
MKMTACLALALISLAASASAQTLPANRPVTPVNVYVAPFTSRDSIDHEILSSLRDLFEESFENAFSSNGTYTVLNREAIERIIAESQNEAALASIDDLTTKARARLKVARADGVIFGAVTDDKDSGEVIVSVKLQNFDSLLFWNRSVSIKRGLIHDRSSRQDAMEQLVRLISGSLQTNPSIGSSNDRSIQTRPAGCIIPPKGLVGWWPGDGKMDDIIGGNSPTGSNAVSYLPGKVGYGFTFGTKGWILIPPSPTLENQLFTWAAWVRVDGDGTRNDQIGAAILGQSSNVPFLVPVQLLWRPMDDRFVFQFGDPRVRLYSQHSFPPGTFYFVAGEYDGREYRLFVNGVLEGSTSLQQKVHYSSSTPWAFGQGGLYAVDTFPRTWNGVIDEVQAFNRDLTQSEIEAIYNAGAKGECKPAH